MNFFHINRSELVRGGRIFISLFIIASLIFLSPAVSAADAYEAYRRASTAVENLAAEIRMSEGAVGQTLMEAMNGKHGEIDKWKALDEKMSALGATIDSNLPAIGQNAAVIFAQNPNANLPGVALGRTFDGNLRMVSDKRNGLTKLVIVENNKLDKINQKLAQVDTLIAKAVASYGKQGALDLIPLPNDFWEFGGESTVAVLALYSNPVGWVALVAVGVIGGISTVNKNYVNSKTLADRINAYNQMKELLLEKKKVHGDNFKILNDGAKEMHEIERILQKSKDKMEEYKAQINAAVDGWNGQSQAAFETKKQKLEEEAKKRAAKPKKTIKPRGWAYGMNPVPPIQPGEYAGELDSMIAEMESYTKAVEDGGDPDNFQSMVVDWSNDMTDQYLKVLEDYKKKTDAYHKASDTCYKQISQAAQVSGVEYKANLQHASCRPNWFNMLSSTCLAGLAAISNRYDAAVKAAYAGLKPYGKALVEPIREMIRMSAIFNRVGNVYDMFSYRIDNATKARTKEFWRERALWQTKYYDVNNKVYQTVSDVPYWLPEWKNRADKIDATVESALHWGQDIVSVRNGLLATANQLKELDKTVKDANKAYQEANTERISVSNQAQSELEDLLTKYGRLINHNWAENFSMPSLGRSKAEFTPHAPWQDLTIENLSKDIEKTFRVYEPGNLEAAKKVDLLSIAQIYENKAQELIFYTDWIETYRFRLSAAISRLDQISRKQTGTGLYADRGGSPAAVLAEEFSEAPFGSIMKEADGLVNAEELGKLPWIKAKPWAGMDPWQKLYASQTILLNKINDEMKSYVQARNGGSFRPVNQHIIRPLEERWKKLRALCKRHDAAAKPLRENIGSAEEDIRKDVALVWETYNKMPKLSRNAVSDQHKRFHAAYTWLSEYVDKKREALRSTLEPPTNSVAVKLDKLITEYRPALEKYRRQQQDDQRRMEEMQKRFKEEELKRAEEERMQQEEERMQQEELQKQASAELDAVKDLYDRFKEAYESRNDSQVMSFLADGWESGDGSTIDDLQMNLSRTFRAFDEIRYSLQNMKIQKQPDNSYMVSYDVIITSRIYRRNIKHEEKSSVSELVNFEDGKAKITRTLNGRFWYVE